MNRDGKARPLTLICSDCVRGNLRNMRYTSAKCKMCLGRAYPALPLTELFERACAVIDKYEIRWYIPRAVQ